DLLRIPAVLPEDLLPEEGPPPRMTLALFPRTYAGVSLLELLCLILLLKRSKAGAVFEFGTYKGVSTTQLALNLPENGSVATLDLPEDHAAAFDESPYAGRMDFVFVDGAHSADYVRNDSEKGWRMLREGGIMAWHDCCVND